MTTYEFMIGAFNILIGAVCLGLALLFLYIIIAAIIAHGGHIREGKKNGKRQ
jgi:hypothetical protein